MKRSEIRVGETYNMKHSSGLIQVKIIAVKPTVHYGHWTGQTRLCTQWRAINLKTNREIVVKSGVKLSPTSSAR
jgi:hypothetical protein